MKTIFYHLHYDAFDVRYVILTAFPGIPQLNKPGKISGNLSDICNHKVKALRNLLAVMVAYIQLHFLYINYMLREKDSVLNTKI